MIESGFSPGKAHVLTHCMTLPLNIIESLVSLNILELSDCRENSHCSEIYKAFDQCISQGSPKQNQQDVYEYEHKHINIDNINHKYINGEREKQKQRQKERERFLLRN